MSSSSPVPISSSSDSDRRTTYSILWSCLTTIFLCTWVSLHPNLPKPTKEHTLLEKLRRRVNMLLVALVAPELTTVWAMRQWWAARRMTQEYGHVSLSTSRSITRWLLRQRKKISVRKAYEATRLTAIETMGRDLEDGPKWTSTHSFFTLMGGFVLVRRSPDGAVITIQSTLVPEDLSPWVDRIKMQISEQEISDRSKGDGLTKALAIHQTGWFILQFFARLYNHLGITELELVTMAYAFLNIGTYAFWWNKPLDIQCPVQLTIHDSDRVEYVNVEDSELEANVESFANQLLSAPNAMVHVLKNADVMGKVGKVVFGLLVFPFFFTAWLILFAVSWPCVVIFTAIISILASHPRRDISSENARLWRYFHGDSRISYATWVAWSLSILFGAVHCAAWSFPFPSTVEKIIWRVSAGAVVLIPSLALVMTALAVTGILEHRFIMPVRMAVFLFAVTLPPALYIAARCILLVQMFVLLRSQPESVYIPIDWVSYFPHV